MKLEVIAQNQQDILKINQSEADGIEFCHNLDVGGLTPSYDDIIVACKISKLPINIMIRPTARDFVYTDGEFQQMLKDAQFIAKTNVHGVVFGILTKDNEIDILRMKALIAAVPTKEKVFHKAFDLVKDFTKAMQVLAKLGINTVLTSGGHDINENGEILKNITSLNLVTVMAGGGINFSNISSIAKFVNKIHIGTAARIHNNWNSEIDLKKIKHMKKLVKEN